MDPGSAFLMIVVVIVVVGAAVFLFLTSAGLELREGRRRRHGPRPRHTRVENEQHAVSSPPRSEPSENLQRRGGGR